MGAAALFSARDLKAQSSEVLTCVDGLSESVKAQDFGAAAEDAQQIANLSGDMVDKLSSPLWTAVFFVPVVGRLDGFMKGLPCVEPPFISWTREIGGFLMSGDLRHRYDESMRRMAAELFADGCGYHSAATRLGLPPATVRKWHRAHVALGLEGLLAMGKKIRSYRWELKASAARDVVEGGGDGQVDLLLRAPPPAEAHEARALGKAVEVFSRTANGCGHRQIAMCLRAEVGARIADKTALKMMREIGTSCGIRRETDYHRYNSYKGVVGKTFENVLGRDFAADGPWEKMGTDVTEFRQPWGRRTSRRRSTSAAAR